MTYWNNFNTADKSEIVCKTVEIPSKDKETLQVYLAKPVGQGNHPGVILIPHMPGWDQWCRETSYRLASFGYNVVCPNIYQSFGTGTPVEVSTRAREAGMVEDKSVMEDTASCIEYLNSLDDSNEKVGVIGMCSGGRHAFMAACSLDNVDAAVDCWGGGVCQTQLSASQPVSPVTLSENLNCPILGIFGNDDKRPDVNEVNELEETLKSLGKDYSFYRYDGAGHGIWYYDKPMYRQQQAMDSLEKVLEFFDDNLKK